MKVYIVQDYANVIMGVYVLILVLVEDGLGAIEFVKSNFTKLS